MSQELNIPVSVIVAVYNAEKTLPRLLDSLKAQTMQVFEVLLIDDGSKDDSGAICDRYSETDSRVKVFHKQNEGIGATRQFGIEHATGEFTIHTDADDWVEPDYLEQLYNAAVSSGADMVVCDFWRLCFNRTNYMKQEPESFDTGILIQELLGRLANSPWNKLLRRSFYMDRNIRYTDGLNYGEDQLFNLQMIKAGASVAYLPKALYHYDMDVNPASAVQGFTIAKINHREKFISELKILLPSGYETFIDNKHLEVAYMAIMSGEYTKKQFLDTYSYLSRVRWREYRNQNSITSIKIIIWTALHVSFRLALVFSAFKKYVRRLRQ